MSHKRTSENPGHAGQWQDQWGRADTEKFIISAMLQCPAETAKTCYRLKGKHFSTPALGAIWDGIACHEKPEDVDAVAVMRDAFKHHIRREPKHFLVWAKDLIDANPAPVTARLHLARLRTLAARDKAKRAIEAAVSALNDWMPADVVRGAFNATFTGAA